MADNIPYTAGEILNAITCVFLAQDLFKFTDAEAIEQIKRILREATERQAGQ